MGILEWICRKRNPNLAAINEAIQDCADGLTILGDDLARAEDLLLDAVIVSQEMKFKWFSLTTEEKNQMDMLDGKISYLNLVVSCERERQAPDVRPKGY